MAAVRGVPRVRRAARPQAPATRGAVDRRGRRHPPEPVAATERALPRILAVGELTRHIKDALRDAPRLRDLWVEGEVGQVSISSAGHCYFTLKDERAQVRCMIFRDDRMAIPFQPRTGVRLVAHGRVDVFEAQGVYQLYVDTLQPAGFGDLALRFEALKAQLTKEGLFDSGRKRPLPPWPRTIGICTSLSGAVLHDMRKVLARRWPSVRVLVSACQVQGPGAPESIVAALRRMARWTDATTGRARGRGHPRPRRWLDGGPVGVQRGGRGACRGRVPGAHRGRRRPRDGRHARRVRGGRPCRHAVGGRGAVRPVAGRTSRHGCGPSTGGWPTPPTARSRRPAAQLDAERRALEAFRPSAYLAAERERAGLLLDRATRAVTARLEVDAGRLAAARRPAADGAPGTPRPGPHRPRPERGDPRRAEPVRDARPGLRHRARRGGRASCATRRDRARRATPLDVRLARGALDVRVERVPDSAP